MYSKMFQLQTDLFKALAHPRRLEIVHLLRDQELPVTDIHTMLDLPQANISQHLMILREAEVVTTRKEGKHMYYSLAHPHIISACDLVRELLIDQHQDIDKNDPIPLRMKDFVPLTQDPVCHMRVSPKTAGFHFHHNDTDYYFCASGCLKIFQKDPQKYVK